MILAIEHLPSPELIIFAVAVLIGLLGKLVSFAKRVRERSIEAQREDERTFGADLEEAPEPPPALQLRLDLVRRVPRPRVEAPAPAPPPPPHKPAPAAPPRRLRRENEIARLLRTHQGARAAVVLAEVLGRPKSVRRGR